MVPTSFACVFARSDRLLGNSVSQLLIAGVALSALDSVLLQVVFTTADDTGHDNWNDARRGHEDEDLQPPFFPFPFTSKRLDPQPYKGSGPEWREFVRIANDKPLQKAIKRMDTTPSARWRA